MSGLALNADQAVVATAYAHAWQVTSEAQNAANWKDPRLPQVLTGKWLNRVQFLILVQKNQGKRGYGTSKIRLQSIRIKGSVATVLDCHDTSTSGVMTFPAGKKLTVGFPREKTETTMLLTNGTWKISRSAVFAGVSC